MSCSVMLPPVVTFTSRSFSFSLVRNVCAVLTSVKVVGVFPSVFSLGMTKQSKSEMRKGGLLRNKTGAIAGVFCATHLREILLLSYLNC